MLSFPLLVLITYLVTGMFTTIQVWSVMKDELDLAIGLESVEEELVPIVRMLLTIAFVLAWPAVLLDSFRR